MTTQFLAVFSIFKMFSGGSGGGPGTIYKKDKWSCNYLIGTPVTCQSTAPSDIHKVHGMSGEIVCEDSPTEFRCYNAKAGKKPTKFIEPEGL